MSAWTIAAIVGLAALALVIGYIAGTYDAPEVWREKVKTLRQEQFRKCQECRKTSKV